MQVWNPYEEYARWGCPDPVCPLCGRQVPDLVEVDDPFLEAVCSRCLRTGRVQAGEDPGEPGSFFAFGVS